MSEAEFEIPSGRPDIISLATQLWGKPTKRTPGKALFGAHGSKCVQPAPINKWFDHEANVGGGYLDLYKLNYGKLPDLPGFPIPPGMAKELGNPVAWWDYQNAACQPVARVARFHPPGQDKDYRQFRWEGGRWRAGMKGLELPLYHLPELLKAPDDSTVYITEGEKHADQIRAWGMLATTNAGGAKKFRADHAAVLAKFDCVICPDNDEAGRKHAEVVASALQAAGCTSIRVLNLPNLPTKGDVIDWVRAGGTATEFAELVAQAPDWAPSPKAQPTKPKPPAGDIPTMQAYHALRDALDKNSNGAVLPTHANMVLILKGDPILTGLVQFNSFTGLHMLRKPIPVLDKSIRPSPGPYPRPWDGDDITRLLAYVQKSWAHNFKKATVEECLLLEGRDNEIHCVRDYLDGLQWDGTKRLDLWLTMTFGCPSDDYHKAVGSKLLIAAVRRVRKPGCKYDQLVVLEGPQDIGKSTAILILFGADWTTDRISDLSSKDAAIDLRGKWCVELPRSST